MAPLVFHRRAALLVLPAVATVLVTGCEIRDEQARPRAVGLRWPDPVTGRLDQQGPAAHSSGQTSISFVDDCDAGRRLAEAADKPLLVVFRADWCRWSAAFSQQTLTDPAIVALADRFVCVQVDADRHSKICQRYAVSQFPTVLILDADNNELSRRSGHTLATDLKPLLRQALSPRQLAAVETPQATESVTATTDAGNQPAPVQLQTADMPGDEISR